MTVRMVDNANSLSPTWSEMDPAVANMPPEARHVRATESPPI